MRDLADAQQLRLAAGGDLPWHETEPRVQVSPSAECSRVADRCDQRGRIHGADAGNGGQTSCGLVALGVGGELDVKHVDAANDRPAVAV